MVVAVASAPAAEAAPTPHRPWGSARPRGPESRAVGVRPPSVPDGQCQRPVHPGRVGFVGIRAVRAVPADASFFDHVQDDGRSPRSTNPPAQRMRFHVFLPEQHSRPLATVMNTAINGKAVHSGRPCLGEEDDLACLGGSAGVNKVIDRRSRRGFARRPRCPRTSRRTELRSLTISQTVDPATLTSRTSSSPWMRRYPRNCFPAPTAGPARGWTCGLVKSVRATRAPCQNPCAAGGPGQRQFRSRRSGGTR